MKERRGFLVALSTTLIGVGLAALVASLIALATVPEPFRIHYGWVPPFGIAIGVVSVVAGIAAGVAWEVSWRRSRSRHLRLGAFLGEARELASVIGEMRQAPAISYEQLQAWEERVSSWIATNLPEYSEHFLNMAGTGLLIRDESLRVVMLRSLEVRMQRISEVILEL